MDAEDATVSYEQDDDKILQKMWGGCFIGQMISHDIYRAINVSNGNDRNRAQTRVASYDEAVYVNDSELTNELSSQLSISPPNR